MPESDRELLERVFGAVERLEASVADLLTLLGAQGSRITDLEASATAPPPIQLRRRGR